MRRPTPNTLARITGLAIATGATVILGGEVLFTPPAHAHLHLNLNQIGGLRQADLIYGLRAVGLSPETLAAAGANEERTIAVVAAAASYLGNNPSELWESVRLLGDAAAEVERLERLVRIGAAVEPEALQLARHDKATAQSLLNNLFSGLRTTAMSPLTIEQRAALNALMPNLSREVPVAFQIVERSDEEWTALRDALANEAQTAAEISSEDTHATALLATVRNQEDVARAQGGIIENFLSVEQAFYATISTIGE